MPEKIMEFGKICVTKKGFSKKNVHFKVNKVIFFRSYTIKG